MTLVRVEVKAATSAVERNEQSLPYLSTVLFLQFKCLF